VYVTELLTDNGRCAGLLGFSTDTGDLYLLKAKATVIASGQLFKTPDSWVIIEPSDGESLAYREVLIIVSKEFGGKRRQQLPKIPQYVCNDWDHWSPNTI